MGESKTMIEWRIKTRDAAKYLLGCLTIEMRDKETKALLELLQSPKFNVDLAMMVHQLNTMLDNPLINPNAQPPEKRKAKAKKIWPPTMF